MPTKGEKTMLLIQAEARRLFAAKGYARVTMNDICTATRLSRGGLYRYYGSPREIMLAILTKDKDDSRSALEKAIQKQVSAVKLLDSYWQKVHADFVGGENRFYFAVHEFAFMQPEQQPYMNERFESALHMMVQLLAYGQHTQEFRPFALQAMAEHIVFTTDSLLTASASLPLSTTLLDRQLQLLKDLVIKP